MKFDTIFTMIFNMIFGIAPNIAVIVIAIWLIKKIKKQKIAKQEVVVDLTNSDVKELIDEAVSIMNTILEVGGAISLATPFAQYNGFIIPLVRRMEQKNAYIGEITIYDVCDLRNYSVAPACKEKLKEFEKMDAFVQEYASRLAYDKDKSLFTIQTKTEITLPMGEDYGPKISAMLRDEIAKRCPMADTTTLMTVVYDKRHHYYG